MLTEDLDGYESAFSATDISQQPFRFLRFVTSPGKARPTSLEIVPIKHTPHRSLARTHFRIRLSHVAFLRPEAQEQVRGLSTPDTDLAQCLSMQAAKTSDDTLILRGSERVKRANGAAMGATCMHFIMTSPEVARL